MEQRRELKSGEIDLIEYLAKKAEYPLNKSIAYDTKFGTNFQIF